jgi:hypothetical protein
MVLNKKRAKSVHDREIVPSTVHVPSVDTFSSNMHTTLVLNTVNLNSLKYCLVSFNMHTFETFINTYVITVNASQIPTSLFSRFLPFIYLSI